MVFKLIASIYVPPVKIVSSIGVPSSNSSIIASAASVNFSPINVEVAFVGSSMLWPLTIVLVYNEVLLITVLVISVVPTIVI